MGMRAQVEVTSDHLSSPTAPQGAGHPVRQMPYCVERTWTCCGQLSAPGSSGWVRAQSSERLRAGAGNKASDLPICPFWARTFQTLQRTWVQGNAALLHTEPTLSKQACAQYRLGFTPVAQHPYPSCCSRPASLRPFLSLAAICTAHHPFRTQAPSPTPSALRATSIPEWVASWGDMSRAACQPPLPPVADDAARCTHRW